MNVFLVVDETYFFHPAFLAGVIARAPDKFVGAVLITKISKKNNIDTWLKKNWYQLRFSEMAKLCFKKLSSMFLNLVASPKPGSFYSVRSVLKYYKIDFKEVQFNVNKPENLDFIRSKDPDIILSSCSLIFGKELLSIPKRACINRHSGLLPAFRGLWPVFQAYRNGEPVTGVSVHTMDTQIDRGVVLSQKVIPMPDGSRLYDLYRQCFEISVDAVLEALEKVRNGNLKPVENGKPQSYFSFPTTEHWKQFRSRGGRFI